MSVAMIDHDGSAKFCAYADPAIKLFGRDIPLTQEVTEDPSGAPTLNDLSLQGQQQKHMLQEGACKDPMEIVSCGSEHSACFEDVNKAVSSSSLTSNISPMTEDQVVINAVNGTLSKVEETSPLASEKMPKKPDKLLPCPRCHSLNTKFCYFNNYNVNQPRHFCRKCLRYWTAGGTLRNVPVGAGRRKNKHSALHQKHNSAQDVTSVRNGGVDAAQHKFSENGTTAGTTLNSLPKPKLLVRPVEALSVSSLESPKLNTGILNFGQESPLCRSLAATSLGIQESATGHNNSHLANDNTVAAHVNLNLGTNGIADPQPCSTDGIFKSQTCKTSEALGNAPPPGIKVHEEESNLNAGSGDFEACMSEGGAQVHESNWQSNGDVLPKSLLNGDNTLLPLPLSNMLACNGSQGSFWPGFPWPFMNPAMWGVPTFPPLPMPVYPPGVSIAGAMLPYALPGTQNHQFSDRSQPDKCLWVPKTLRIDDPVDAARSSIWTTLGLRDGPLSSSKHASSKSCQGMNCKDDNEEVSMNRCSNPAALSRSAAFQEKS
ncbi:hypothetical protein KP509_18G081000 [Ceratopteris richardii]|nr:hypothetical protein KP509_18G081000 [Ceratopteris richardii]